MAKKGFIFIILFAAWGCQTKNKDNFYSRTSDWDLKILPLIKPYYATSLFGSDKPNWLIDFDTISGDNATNVKYVNIHDSIIFIWCGQTDVNSDSTIFEGNYIESAWYIIDSKNNKVKGFTNINDFNSYLSSNKFYSPKWLNIDSLWSSLGWFREVPWYDSVGIVRK